ncbi:hypothetical protein SAMN04488009_3152 [Maribacter sedimenticola]|uniref:Lipocalin-like domain-containing protein n=1 Tax=Maribacter sedimenticola TaxID=228956 RepID=A0ABY1SKM5_9FLAO|nr:hypothetical protein [Maribacter sedimenticola]SNR67993.1 hypothetical protein SAMN04488009_3152 [Maribacter sedimenticola]
MRYIALLTLFLATSCSTAVDTKDLPNLNGYWEIKEVRFTDGTKKEYKVNSMVDYITLDSLNGFRKKVQPKFDGSFVTSNDAEPFKILIQNDSIFMEYNNDLTHWREALLSISQDFFSVRNEEGIIYHYQRFEPINITP